MENILKNFEESKEIVYIVNYIVNNEMCIKEFKSMKSATTFARKCRNFRRLAQDGVTMDCIIFVKLGTWT